MSQPECIHCHQLLRVSQKQRRNHLVTAMCHCCKFTYALCFLEDGSFFIQNVQKRFTHNGTIWHMTYLPKRDVTRYIVINNKPRPLDAEGRKLIEPRQEYTVDGLVLPERFLNLSVFL